MGGVVGCVRREGGEWGSAREEQGGVGGLNRVRTTPLFLRVGVRAELICLSIPLFLLLLLLLLPALGPGEKAIIFLSHLQKSNLKPKDG